MPSNLTIEDDLTEQAEQIGSRMNRKASVTEAQTEYIQRRKQMKLTDLFGKIDFDPDYDYKAHLNRKCPS